MKLIAIAFQLVGSLAFLLYGMKMMSDGIQKSAGESLHKTLGLMTNNRVLAILTGTFITMVIQSSSATTVMVVSFVNAGLLTLRQSIGVIFGANIGTTVTAWIVSLFGFNFKIATLAVPLFGLGYLLSVAKRLGKESLGEALMGFGLLFLGLDFLSNAIPKIDAENIQFLTFIAGRGSMSIFLGILAGLLITLVIHSSSAATAIILTMAYNKLLPWEFSAAMVLGSNIGTTIDAVLVSIGTRINAKRAAFIHVFFNVTGTILATIFFHPLLSLIDFLVPGTVESSITTHIAMLHTVFNIFCTLLFLPFVNHIALLTEKIIKPKIDEPPGEYRFEFVSAGMKENAEAHIIRAEKEIADMTAIANQMFARIKEGFFERDTQFITKHMTAFAQEEQYADQMQEEISKFLLHCSDLPVGEKTKNNIQLLLGIVSDLECMTDDCYSVAMLLKRSIEKKMVFDEEDVERLQPYADLTQQFLDFIQKNINRHLSQEELKIANDLENKIDAHRSDLKKIARKRLESGADVKTELLYIDLVRNIEKIGDRAFSISEALAQTK